MGIKVCVAGATGWVGADLCRAIFATDDMELTSAIARKTANENLGRILGVDGLDLKIAQNAAQALETPCDVFVEFANPEIAKENVLMALEAKAHVVVGSSGLSDEDYEEIDQKAKEFGLGVLAAGNFALTSALLLKFATMAAKYIPSWEIIDYASALKPDAPSGTARELAYRLGQVQKPEIAVPIEKTIGPKETRGASLGGCQVHAVRLPGYVASVEAVFGLPDMRLSLKHEPTASPDPYVQGTLLAIRKVKYLVGLKRGLDQVMDF